MEIKINTDNHILGSDDFKEEYKQLLSKSLSRFEQYVTRFEVYFSDENKAKSSPDDKKCVIEARVKGRNPDSVSHNAHTLKHAFDGALDKMKSVLTKVVDQIQEK